VRRLAAAVFLVSTVARNAYAQSAIEDVRFEYRAPAGCPNEDWVVRRIQARTDRFRRVTDAASARSFSIAIAESPAGFLGTLEITEPDASGAGRTTSRRIEAPRCIEVADGLALISALTIDPRAAEAPPIGEASTESGSGSGSEAVARGPEAPSSRPEPLPGRTATEASEDTGTEGADERRSSSYVRVGAGFVGTAGVAPQPMYGGQVFAELGVRPGRRWFAWAARLNLRHVRREGLEFAEGNAHFRLSTAGAELCPFRVPVPTLELGPCLTGELGLLEAEGTENAAPQQSQRAWTALGALLRAGVALDRVGLEVSAGAVAPLRRDRFLIGPEIGRVDFLVWSAGVALTGRFD
jgi:hypothetical protein